jgi:hypothetical protein
MSATKHTLYITYTTPYTVHAHTHTYTHAYRIASHRIGLPYYTVPLACAESSILTPFLSATQVISAVLRSPHVPNPTRGMLTSELRYTHSLPRSPPTPTVPGTVTITMSIVSSVQHIILTITTSLRHYVTTSLPHWPFNSALLA